MANVITRLLLESSQYTKGLQGAQRDLERFVDKNMSMSNVMSVAGKAVAGLAASMGVAMGAVEAANKVLGSAQTLTDEYGRTMEAAKTSVDTFFNAIAIGDFSGFTNSIGAAITKAREFYNELDRLGSIQIFHPNELTKIEIEMEKAKAIIMDKSSSEEAKKAAREQLKALNAELMETSKTLRDQAVKTYYADLRKKLQGYGATASNADIDKYFNSFKNYEDATKRFAELEKKRKDAMEVKTVSRQTTFGGTLTTTKIVDTEESRKIAESLEYKLLRAVSEIGDKALAEAKNFESMALNEERSILSIQNSNLRKIGSGASSGGTTTKKTAKGPDELNRVAMEAEGQIHWDYATMNASPAMKAWMETGTAPVMELPILPEADEDSESGALMGALQTKINAYDSLQAKIQKARELMTVASEEERRQLEQNIAMWEKQSGAIKETAEKGTSIADISSALGTMGNALKATGDGWIGMVGTTMSAIAALIPAIQALTAAEAAEGAAKQSSLPFPANVAAILTTVATVASAISSVKSIANFAEGGIVGGNNFQDGIAARVSSGEMFINQADQKKLYNAIHSGDVGGGESYARLKAETIVVGINNYAKRTGRKGILIK